MHKKNPPGKYTTNGRYSAELAATIKKDLSFLIREDKKRLKDYEKLESDQVSLTDFAEIYARIDKSNFSKLINGEKEYSEQELFRLISMPWVTVKEAQHWIFLWIANQLNKYKLNEYDEGAPLLDDAKSRNWNPNRNLKKIADSLAKLANYTPTLGIIDQIDHARCKRNESIQEIFHLPAEGPFITRHRLDKTVASKYWNKHKRTMLVLKFAQDLANLEAEEHEDEINGYLNEEREILNLEKNLEALEGLKTVLDDFNYNEVESLFEDLSNEEIETLLEDTEIESLLTCLESNITDHIMATKIANKIISKIKLSK